jgi:hypothetical protein
MRFHFQGVFEFEKEIREIIRAPRFKTKKRYVNNKGAYEGTFVLFASLF